MCHLSYKKKKKKKVSPLGTFFFCFVFMLIQAIYYWMIQLGFCFFQICYITWASIHPMRLFCLLCIYSFCFLSLGGDDIKGGGLGRHLQNVSQESLLFTGILEIDAFIYSVYLFYPFQIIKYLVWTWRLERNDTCRPPLLTPHLTSQVQNQTPLANKVFPFYLY